MKIILDDFRFRKYYPQYDVKEKILTLKGKVPVNVLLEIKYLRLMYNLEIEDIRITM